MDLVELRKISKLVPELKRHLEIIQTGETSFPSLRHPLVFSVPYLPQPEFDEHLNKMYKHKKKESEKAFQHRDYEKYVWLHERPNRVHAFISTTHYLPDQDYWTILGEIFIDTENLWQNFDLWCWLLSSERKEACKIMTQEERDIFSGFPEKITVYRGLNSEKQSSDGLSFTINPEKAKWFSNRFRGTGKVYWGVINRKDILAYFNRRGEEEVVILPGKINFVT